MPARLLAADHRVAMPGAWRPGLEARLEEGFWSEGRDSNPRQPAWKAGALPTELPSPAAIIAVETRRGSRRVNKRRLVRRVYLGLGVEVAPGEPERVRSGVLPQAGALQRPTYRLTGEGGPNAAGLLVLQQGWVAGGRPERQLSTVHRPLEGDRRIAGHRRR